MSGIAGIIHFDGRPVEPGLIEKMTGAMAHRGPDGINHWVKRSVALGQCMLRTTPESLEEHQPLTNEDESLVLVMDGRVDNWEDLRRELLSRGAVLRNRSDAELVLRTYEFWGRDCLAHIDGDFSLVIWDAKQHQAFCARDRMGNKPFNYYWAGRTFAFSSEVRSILDLPWVPERLNEGMVAQYLSTEWLSREDTFWRGILRLKPAHRIVVRTRGFQPEQYWTPDLYETLPYSTDEEYIEHYRELFTDVVRRMSRSHRPVAYEVSGGLDSSAIFAVAANLCHQVKLPTPGIEGYTLDFRGDPSADEAEFCQAVSRHVHQPIRKVAPAQMPLSWYRSRAELHREFPGYPNSAMGLSIRARARVAGSRVLMVGVGGDQWLGGSRLYYAEALREGNWRDFLASFKADWNNVGFHASAWWALRYGLVPLLPENVKRLARQADLSRRIHRLDTSSWLVPAMKREMAHRREEATSSSSPAARWVGQRAHLSKLLNPYDTVAGEHEERLCSSQGLALRRPFQHAKIVQYAFSMPIRLRMRGRLNKYTHRKAMGDLLPASVLNRETKAEFSIVFHKHLSEMRGELIDRVAARNGRWVDSAGVEDLYKFYADRADAGWPGWALWGLFGCDAVAWKGRLAPEGKS